MYGYYRGASHPRGGREGPYVMRTHACSVFNHVYVLREAFRNGKYLVRLTECVEGEAAVSDRLGEVSSEFPTVPKQKLPRKEEEEEKKRTDIHISHSKRFETKATRHNYPNNAI